jgi:DNA-binding SARP family transcriptional activator
MDVSNAVVRGEIEVIRDQVFLDLLDGFRLRVGPELVRLSDTAQRLVAFVALGGRPLRRALVSGTLWPEKTESRASANLRSTLWRLNAAGNTPTVVCSGTCLILNPDVCVDVAALERNGWALLDTPTGLIPRQSCDWFSKELLPGWYEDWVIVERERLGQLQIRFLEALVHRLRERGELTRAIDQAMRLVALDPLREHSQLALIRALVDEGSWGRARWQAEQYCQLLDGAFGCYASSAFMAEYRTLLPFHDAVAP